MSLRMAALLGALFALAGQQERDPFAEKVRRQLDVDFRPHRVEEFILKGTAISDKVSLALVICAEGKEHVLKNGMRLDNGRVASIERGLVRFEQDVLDPTKPSICEGGKDCNGQYDPCLIAKPNVTGHREFVLRQADGATS